MMDNAPLTRVVNGESQPGHFLLSVSFSLRVKLLRDLSWLRVTAIRDRSSMQLSVNEDALAIQSFLSPSL